MTYLSDKKQSKTRQGIYATLIFLLLVLVYTWPSFRTRAFPYVLPLVNGYTAVKHTILVAPYTFSTYIKSQSELKERNETLMVTIEHLENELAEKNEMIKQYTILTHDGSSPTHPVIVMYPLTKDVTRLYSTILFSKGFKDGIEKDMTVYVRGRQPVCTIREVYTSTSLCTLFSASGETVEGVVSSSTVQLQGNGGGTFITTIPKTVTINEGDSVMLRSDQSMTLGTVVSVIRDEQATALSVYVRGAYNPITSTIFYIDK